MNTNEKSQKAELRMRRIRKVSGIVRIIFFTILILEIVGIVAAVIVIPVAITHWPAFHSQAAFKNYCSLLTLPFALMVTLNFFRLFTRLKEGQLFESQTIRYLESAGKWWIVLGIIRMFFQFWEAFIYTPNNIIVTGDGIFGGLIVFFIAWVLREGQELKEEQELTV